MTCCHSRGVVGMCWAQLQAQVSNNRVKQVSGPPPETPVMTVEGRRNGLWCSGSTGDFDSPCLSSNLSGPTKEEDMAESLDIFRVLKLERDNLALRMLIAHRDDEIYALSKEVDKLKREIERGRSDKVEHEQRPV